MNLKEQIIKLIRENRISSTEIADVLGKKGHVKKALPLMPGMHKVGEVQLIYAWNGSNWEMHEQLQHTQPGRLIYIIGLDCGEKALFGDLVAKFVLLYKKAEAIVASGLVRDAHTLIKEKYPIWSEGVSPIGCSNLENLRRPDDALLKHLFERFDGAIMVCDDSGVVCIENEFISEDLIKKLEHIELQEDIWYFCLDTHKMTTFDIVCKKKYLSEEEGLLPLKKIIDLKEF